MNGKIFEISARTRVATQLGAAVIFVSSCVAVALWADDVTDSLDDLNASFSRFEATVGTLDDLSVRRSTVQAWIREYRTSLNGWVNEVNAAHPDWKLPLRIVPELPSR